jgi:hypothetical protein
MAVLQLKVPKALAAGSEPETRPGWTWRSGFALLEADLADVRHDRSDSSAPLVGANPAPRSQIRKRQPLVLVCPLMAVLESLGDPGGSGEPVQLMAIRSHNGVVLLDHEFDTVAGGRQIFDEGGEARRTGIPVRPVDAGGVVNSRSPPLRPRSPAGGAATVTAATTYPTRLVSSMKT